MNNKKNNNARWNQCIHGFFVWLLGIMVFLNGLVYYQLTQLSFVHYIPVELLVSNCISIVVTIIFFFIIHRQKQTQKDKSQSEPLKIAYQSLKAHDLAMSLLNQMEKRMQSCQTIDAILTLACRYAKKLLPLSAGTIYLHENNTAELTRKINWHHPHHQAKTILPCDCFAITQQKIYPFMNKKNTVACQHYPRTFALKNGFCIPLIVEKELLGLIILEINGINEKKLSLSHYQPLIKKWGEFIALSIANVELKNDLQIRSLRDPLTKLYNRHYLVESLPREIELAHRSRRNLAVIMMDIDHFKHINDTLGHPVGDTVLEKVADILMKQTRKSDIACRYGGEEFLLIFYDATREAAIKRTENLRQQIQDCRFALTHPEAHHISASFGIAIYPEQGHQADDLIAHADQALYQAKEKGRNQVVVYGDLNRL